MNKQSEPLKAWYELLKLLVIGFVPTSIQDLKFLPIFRYVGPTKDLIYSRPSIFKVVHQFWTNIEPNSVKV